MLANTRNPTVESIYLKVVDPMNTFNPDMKRFNNMKNRGWMNLKEFGHDDTADLKYILQVTLSSKFRFREL